MPEWVKEVFRGHHLIDLWNYSVRTVYWCFLICAFPVSMYWLFFRLPPAGLAIGTLAAIAVVVALRGENVPSIHRAAWSIVTLLFLVVEIDAIYEDRAIQFREHLRDLAQQREAQAQTFLQILLTNQAQMSQNQVQFDATLSELKEEKKLTAKNLEHITGGEGYCWVVPMTPLPVALGGNPAYQGGNWQQIAVKNSAKVVLPTCDVHFVPFPTDEEFRKGIAPLPSDIFYHFEKVPIMGRRYSRSTNYFIRGDRIYSGVIQTPTRSFIEVIKFERDPKDDSRIIAKCTVQAPGGKILESDCNPQ